MTSSEPSPQHGKLVPISIAQEMKSSFIDYAMSIIVSRALPDVRDGLKPVHRRILYAMHEIGLSANKPYKKCARIVGEVLGKYHPHGDTAVYDALVRLAQPFSSRYKLIDGHGNFGSLDDNAAAMRYTEARVAPISHEILADIESDTVDFQDNFDGSLQEPQVLPSKVPTLLLNGTTGIAVGMATNIPPHNLGEIVDGLVYQIDNPDCEVEDLFPFIKGPDFPSGGFIMGTQGARSALATGKGSVTIRGKAEIQISAKGKSHTIAITELPYLLGPEALIGKIADLVKSDKLQGVSDLNDESDRKGTRVIIKLKKDANPDIVLNNLYKLTPLQQNFAVNTLALVHGHPRLLNIKQIFEHFIEHRVEVITRKGKFDLRKAQAREHIVVGLLKALDSLDAIINTIRSADSTDDARQQLMEEFGFSEKQAGAILDMQLRRITGLEREKLESEHKELTALIARLIELINNRHLILNQIKGELADLKKKYADERKTQIVFDAVDLSNEDLIPNKSVVLFFTSQGYIKHVNTDVFESQQRAGKGKGGISFREEDDLLLCFEANMHDVLLFFTTRGVVYTAKTYEVPEGARQTKGKALVNVIPILPEEQCTAIIPVQRPFRDDGFLIMLTKNGVIKKVTQQVFENVRKSGIKAINLNDESGDELGWVRSTGSGNHIFIATEKGMMIRYSEDQLRPLGRSAAGVRAITLRPDDKIACCETLDPLQEENLYVLLVTEDGYGKRVAVSEFRDQNRGGIGLIGIKFKRPESKLSGIILVSDEHEVIIATANGTVLRQKACDIPRQSRTATGVRLQNLDENDYIVSVISHVVEEDK